MCCTSTTPGQMHARSYARNVNAGYGINGYVKYDVLLTWHYFDSNQCVLLNKILQLNA